MKRDEALVVVRRIMLDKLGVEPKRVVPEAHLREDLALDSLDTIDLIQSVEDEFGDELDQAEINKVATVSDILDVVEVRLPSEKPFHAEGAHGPEDIV
jgi:acyl carrier protein